MWQYRAKKCWPPDLPSRGANLNHEILGGKTKGVGYFQVLQKGSE